MIKKFIGTKQFYKHVFTIAAPIIIQNVITNVVNLLDNVMVGQVGTEAMSGVAVIGQLIFVFNLGIFGYTSGVGIVGTQYVGKKDDVGFANSFRIKIGIGIVYIILCFGILFLWGDKLIMSYIHDGEAGLDMLATFEYAKEYLKVMLWGLPFFMVSQIYATTLREMRQTRVPMLAGLAAVFVNLILNYVLIYGHFGFPKLGIIGAAIATDISRVAEFLICVIWSHKHKDEAVFVKGLFKGKKIERSVIKMVLVVAIPALINELLWAGGQTLLNQCMSLRGIEVVSAISIQSTVNILFKCTFISIGATMAILLGNALGAKDEELAVDIDNKMIVLSFAVTIVLAAIAFSLAPVIPRMYNIVPEAKEITTLLIKLCAIIMPVDSGINSFYNTIKAGGNPLLNFLYDGGYTWIVLVPLAYIIGNFTTISIGPMFIIVYYTTSVLKWIIGFILVKKRVWVKTLVD